MDFKHITFSDTDGNIYEITINGRVYLTLSSDKKKRRKWIGTINRYTKTLEKDSRNTYIFYKTKEFGFPYELLYYLLNSKMIEEIQITLKGVQYTLPITLKELKNANFRYFKKQGYEKQIFIPISKFKKEVIR